MNRLIAATKWYEDPSTYMMIILVVVLGLMIYFSSKRRKSAQQQVEKMLDELRPGQRVRTVGGIIGRIKEIREEGPGVKTVLLQTGSDKNPAYALFDIQAIYGVIAEEGHTLQGTITPATETKAIGTASNKADVLASKKTEIASGLDSESTKTEVEQDNFNAREYVEKRNKTAKKK